MNSTTEVLPAARMVPAHHGARPIPADPDYELGLSAYLREHYDRAGLAELGTRYQHAVDPLGVLIRRAVWRALVKKLGAGVTIEPGVGWKHPETFEIGGGVFIGSNAFFQGRHDGSLRIGERVWIGPQAYFDARALVIEDDVGWGPGAKVLGSTHTGLPVDVPIIRTDLWIKPVHIGAEADIGTGAIILPGVTIGRGAIIGAGAVVASDVPAYAIAAGIPARVIRWREGHGPEGVAP